MRPSEEDILAVVKAHNAAWNARDLEAIMDFYTDDVVFAVGPKPLPPGAEMAVGKRHARSAIRPGLPGFHAEAWDYQVSGDTVSWRFRYSNDYFRERGVDSLEGVHEAVFEGDKIKLWTITLSPETVEKLGANLTEPL